MTTESEARKWIVSGHVQGVGFRLYVYREAEHLGLRGTVRNTATRAVEVVAYGPIAALEELSRKLEQGPPASRVSMVDAQPFDGDAESLPSTFTIAN